MAITQEQMNRVIYSKYLLERAKARQSEGNELASAEAIVLAHDSAEMLMRVAYDHLGIAQPYPFMDFWKLVEKKTKQPVPLKSQMDGLNKQRIEFKHGGRLPNPKTVAALLPNVEAFCEEISQLYLDKLGYRSASLAALIQNSDAKKYMEAADIAQGKGDIPQALTELRDGRTLLENFLVLARLRRRGCAGNSRESRPSSKVNDSSFFLSFMEPGLRNVPIHVTTGKLPLPFQHRELVLCASGQRVALCKQDTRRDIEKRLHIPKVPIPGESKHGIAGILP
jgi:hypothetical protein